MAVLCLEFLFSRAFLFQYSFAMSISIVSCYRNLHLLVRRARTYWCFCSLGQKWHFHTSSDWIKCALQPFKYNRLHLIDKHVDPDSTSENVYSQFRIFCAGIRKSTIIKPCIGILCKCTCHRIDNLHATTSWITYTLSSWL